MSGDPTIGDVLEAVQSLATHMDERFMQVDQRFERVDRRFESIDSRFERIDQQFKSIDFHFIRLESEMDRGFRDVRSEMSTMKQDILTEIDGLAVRHQTTDLELAALRSRCDRMETFMGSVGKKLDITYEPTSS